jgi:hypothetical protein
MVDDNRASSPSYATPEHAVTRSTRSTRSHTAVLARALAVVVVALAVIALVACPGPERVRATPPAKAAVGGKRVWLKKPDAPKVTGADCDKDKATLDALPDRLRDAAAGALASVGFAVVDDEKAAHELEARVDSDVTYCNSAIHSAQGSAGVSLAKDGAVVHRSAEPGELGNPAALSSLMSDVVDNLVRDPAVVAAFGAEK